MAAQGQYILFEFFTGFDCGIHFHVKSFLCVVQFCIGPLPNHCFAVRQGAVPSRRSRVTLQLPK